MWGSTKQEERTLCGFYASSSYNSEGLPYRPSTAHTAFLKVSFTVLYILERIFCSVFSLLCSCAFRRHTAVKGRNKDGSLNVTSSHKFVFCRLWIVDYIAANAAETIYWTYFTTFRDYEINKYMNIRHRFKMTWIPLLMLKTTDIEVNIL